jgi:DNA-binding CsgD family transcriptional regulator
MGKSPPPYPPEFRREAIRLVQAGDLATARSWLEAHDRWLDWSGAVLGQAEGFLLWARLYLAEDNTDKAHAYAVHAFERANDPEQPLALIAVHRFLGELTTSARDFDEADQHLKASLELAEDCAAPYERALTLLAQAEREAERGNISTARDLLVEVRRICSDLGAQPTLERVKQLTASLQPRQTEPRFGLSPRELDVLRLLVQGKSDKEIADELFISHHTVMRLVSSILRKLDVDSRAAAAVAAVRRDLV